MGSFMRGREIVEIAQRHWLDRRWPWSQPSIHPETTRTTAVPVRDKLENKFEAQGILKQLEVPRSDWPEKLR